MTTTAPDMLALDATPAPSLSAFLNAPFRCTGCGHPWASAEDHRTVKDGTATGLVVCSGCGHVFRLDNGRPTEANRAKLRKCVHAEQMKEAQAEIVKHMIG